MIGLMGGTFNPIHYGHLRPSLEIAEHLSFEQVHFIPAKSPALRKSPEVSAKHRSKMVELAIQDENNFLLDQREINRTGISYTVDTLEELRNEYGDEKSLCWLMGMDAYLSFTKWKKWQRILELSHLIVSSRPGYEASNPALEQFHATDSSELFQHISGKIYFVPVTQLDISATMIRRRRKNNQSIRYLLPDAVHHYINENQLYL